MFLRSNLRLKIGLIIFKVNSNYINDGTWLAAVATRWFLIRASTNDCLAANDANRRRFPPFKMLCNQVCLRRPRAG